MTTIKKPFLMIWPLYSSSLKARYGMRKGEDGGCVRKSSKMIAGSFFSSSLTFSSISGFCAKCSTNQKSAFAKDCWPNRSPAVRLCLISSALTASPSMWLSSPWTSAFCIMSLRSSSSCWQCQSEGLSKAYMAPKTPFVTSKYFSTDLGSKTPTLASWDT